MVSNKRAIARWSVVRVIRSRLVGFQVVPHHQLIINWSFWKLVPRRRQRRPTILFLPLLLLLLLQASSVLCVSECSSVCVSVCVCVIKREREWDPPREVYIRLEIDQSVASVKLTLVCTHTHSLSLCDSLFYLALLFTFSWSFSWGNAGRNSGEDSFLFLFFSSPFFCMPVARILELVFVPTCLVAIGFSNMSVVMAVANFY